MNPIPLIIMTWYIRTNNLHRSVIRYNKKFNKILTEVWQMNWMIHSSPYCNGNEWHILRSPTLKKNDCNDKSNITNETNILQNCTQYSIIQYINKMTNFDPWITFHCKCNSHKQLTHLTYIIVSHFFYNIIDP